MYSMSRATAGVKQRYPVVESVIVVLVNLLRTLAKALLPIFLRKGICSISPVNLLPRMRS